MFIKWISIAAVSVALITCGPVSAAPSYTLYGVGGFRSDVQGINDLGQAVGNADMGESFVWTLNAGFQSLGIKGSSAIDYLGRSYSIDFGRVYAINSSGHVTGSVYADGGGYSDQTIPIIWQSPGSITLMPIRRSPDNWQGGRGLSINDSVEVVGGGQRNRGSGLGRDSFLWDGSLGTTPITVNSLWNELTGINDNGLAVGWSKSPSFVDAFTWDDASGTTLLGKEAGTSNYAFGVNDLGHAVGSAQYGENGYFGLQTATLWYDPLSWIKIGDLSGGIERSEAVAINGKNQVVGWGTTDSGEEAFYWDELAGLVSLAELVDENLAGWTLLRANAINDSGWIGGTGINPQGGVEGFVLVPNALIPAPATLGLLVVGLAGTGLMRGKRKMAG